MNPYSGMSARIRIGYVNPDLTTDVVTYGTPTMRTVSGAISWSLTPQPIGQFPESLTLESEATNQGLLTPELYRGGAVKWTINCEAEVDDTANQPLLAMEIGQFCMVDLVFKKATGRGYPQIKCRVSSLPINTGTNVPLAKMSWTFEVSGKLPAIGTVS